jgi:CDP-diacylglycerol--serine O-phosphatidyltransferase
MISRFAFNSFKQVNPNSRVRFAHIVIVPLAFVAIALHPATSLLLLFGGYALSAPTVWAYRKLRRRSRTVPQA